MTNLQIGNRSRSAERPTLTAEIVNRNGVVALRLKGRITIYGGGRALMEMIDEAIECGARRIVLNLERVKFVDSSGLGQLVASQFHVRNQGARMCLCSLSPKVFDLLRTTELVRVFDIFEDENEAIASLARKAALAEAE